MKTSQKKTPVIKIIGIVAIVAFVIAGFVLLGHGNGNTSAQGGNNSGSFGSNLIGKPAPQFSLKDRNGMTYSSDSLKGKNVVLFFNEGIMCYPACWNQMVALATDPQFQTTDTVALSVVIDSSDEWQSAIQKMPDLGKATVLFDTDKYVSQEFGMLTAPSSMHYGSFPGHSFVVIDKQGIVRFVFDDPNMGIDNDKIAGDIKMLN